MTIEALEKLRLCKQIEAMQIPVALLSPARDSPYWTICNALIENAYPDFEIRKQDVSLDCPWENSISYSSRSRVVSQSTSWTPT